MKKLKFDMENDIARVLLVLFGSIFSTLILVFAVMAITRLQIPDLQAASVYLLLIFAVLGISRLVTFIKERTKISFLRFIVLLVFDLALGVLIFFGKDNPYIYSLCGGLYCLTIIVSRIFRLINDHSSRSIILNAIIIAFAALLAVALFIPYQNEYALASVLIVCFTVVINALVEVLSTAFYQLKIKTLFKIIIRTYALEVIFGLLTMMVASSLLFMYYEDTIPTFWDGLWYSFTVVTTIGFGDFAATTIIGRIVSVLLGIYGIIVVAVITSIIVNFYNETAGKKDSQELKEIKKEINKNK